MDKQILVKKAGFRRSGAICVILGVLLCLIPFVTVGISLFGDLSGILCLLGAVIVPLGIGAWFLTSLVLFTVGSVRHTVSQEVTQSLKMSSLAVAAILTLIALTMLLAATHFHVHPTNLIPLLL